MTVSDCGAGRTKPNGPPNGAASTAPYSALVGSGIDLLAAGNLSGAEQLFRQAITKEPRSPVAYYDLGVTYQRFGALRLAGRAYRHATAVDPIYLPALNNLAYLVERRNPALAIFCFSRLNELKPHTPMVLFQLALLTGTHGRVSPTTITYLREAVTLDPALRAQIPARLHSALDPER
jgi:Flp pilus assembly protein TadD